MSTMSSLELRTKITSEPRLELWLEQDKALPAGNEGAGVVVEAGSDVRALVGRVVAARSPLGMYAQYRVVKASDCLVLPDGISARQGRSWQYGRSVYEGCVV
jgi:NADPH:quinone reductase-like Zn-dependent oxidoreductase